MPPPSNQSYIQQSPHPNLAQSVSPLPKTPGNKWLNKNANINTKLFSILSANDDEALFAFLRDSANYNGFGTIDNYLVQQLYARLVDLLARSANDNSIAAEYSLRWLLLALNAGVPDNERDTKKFQSLLFYLSNNVDDDFLKEKIVQVLSHAHFDNGDSGNLSYA